MDLIKRAEGVVDLYRQLDELIEHDKSILKVMCPRQSYRDDTHEMWFGILEQVAEENEEFEDFTDLTTDDLLGAIRDLPEELGAELLDSLESGIDCLVDEHHEIMEQFIRIGCGKIAEWVRDNNNDMWDGYTIDTPPLKMVLSQGVPDYLTDLIAGQDEERQCEIVAKWIESDMAIEDNFDELTVLISDFCEMGVFN